jgi:hypothetical protein
MPWIVNSMRILFGRDISMVNGASMPCPIVILPDRRWVWTALSLSLPPIACRCLSMISSAV